MISSRANSTVFGGSETLSDLRKDLAHSLEEEELLLGERLFEVWIHETARAAPGTRGAWEESMKQVREADVPAREMVGQPFLRDHEAAVLLQEEKAAGPVHLVLCHRGITESQGMRVLGFPDATVVSPPFGLYVVDDVQNIQLVFVANCRDETATRYGVQRFFDWLRGTGERDRLVTRAGARRRIVEAIARERPVLAAEDAR